MKNTGHGAGRRTPPIAIIGMGCMFPGARDLTEYWRSLRNGLDGIGPVPETHWKSEDYFDPDPKRPDMTYCARGGFLAPVPFDPTEFGIPPAILEATDTTQLLSLVVAKAALEDAGYGEDRDFNRDRVSVILGITGTQELVLPLSARLGHPIWRRALNEAGVSPGVAEDVVRRIADAYVPWQENSFPGLLGNVVAGRIANRLNLRGTNCVVDAACASSIGAVHLAALELLTGRCEMALAGGADTLNDIFMYMCFSKTPALSPSGDARPFARDADGTVLGEGVGLLVLKRLADAERDGDRIYAVLRGIGTSSDGRSQSIYAPHAAGQARALREAYRLAGFGPEAVELIEAHGTGTKVGDASEFEALGDVFREARSEGQWCALGSVKSQIGHTKAAAGVAGLIKATLAIYHKALPPSIKIDRPNPKLNIEQSPFYLSTELRPWLPRGGGPRRAGVSAFGFGGSNFHAVLEEHIATLPAVAWDGSVQIIAFSAETIAGLESQIDEWLAVIESGGMDRLVFAYRAARSRQAFSTADPHRLVLFAGSVAPASRRRARRRDACTTNPQNLRALQRNLWHRRLAGGVTGGTPVPQFGCGQGPRCATGQEKGFPVQQDNAALVCLLQQAKGRLSDTDEAQWSLPNAFYGSGAAEGTLAFLFPGQGSQYPGMGCDLACTFPEVLDTFSEAQQAVDDPEHRLCDFVYAPPTFDEDRRRQDAARLTRTDVAQPAIGTLSLGLARVLERFAVRADLVAGHSYGELVALHVAGRYDAETLHRLSRLRGRLMAEGDGGRGMMLAVRAPGDALQSMIGRAGLDLVIANRNAPEQHVLSGEREAIAQAAEACQRAGWATTPLRVGGAFHSRLMEGAVQPFRNALEAVDFREGSIEVFANTTGRAYPQEAAEARRLLGEQLVRPVDFVGQIESLYDAGARAFMEVGPRAVLTGLVREILGDRPHQAMAVDVSAGRRSGLLDLARLLAQLAAGGREVALARWERPAVEPRSPRMVVPLVGANYRAPSSKTGREVLPQGAKHLAAEVSESRGAAVSGSPVAPVSNRCNSPGPNLQREDEDESVDSGGSGTTTAPHRLETGATTSGTGATTSGTGATTSGTGATTSGTGATTLETGATIESSGMPTEGSRPAETAAMSTPDSSSAEALRLLRQGIEAMQKLQQETAEAHRLFLIGQEQAHKTIQSLLEQQGSLATGSPSVHTEPSKPASDAESVTSDRALPDGPHRLETGATARPSAATKLWHGRPARGPTGETPVPQGSVPQDSVPQGSVPQGSSQDAKILDVSNTGSGAGAAGLETGATRVLGPQREAIESIVVEVVCEKTGYPAEMIELDMDIEADLGVDSIKRVEIVAALEERIEQFDGVKPDHMGSIRTLGQIVDLIANGQGTEKGFSVQHQVQQGGQQEKGLSARQDVPSHSPASDQSKPQSVSAEAEQDADGGAVVAETLLEVVAELTGYPREMLELNMDLEADLGIDSIKRVEIIAAMEGRISDLPPVAPDHMGSIRTLRQIVEHCTGTVSTTVSTAGAKDDAVEAESVESAASAEAAFDPHRRVLKPCELGEARPGALHIAQGREVWVSDDGDGLAATVVRRLEAMGQRARLVPFDSLEGMDQSPVGGLILVAPRLAQAEVDEDRAPRGQALWTEASEAMVKGAFAMIQAVADRLIEGGGRGGALLATVSRMDGVFGLSGGEFDPVQGGLAGLVKTAAREWQCVDCRAIDVARSWADNEAAAAAVVQELACEGPMEVGLDSGARRGLALEPMPVVAGQPALAAGDVVLITGGARGVTAEAALALAHRYRPTLVLLGRTGLSDDEPPWLADCRTERQVKTAVRENEFADGEKPKPREVNQAAKRYLAQREIKENLQRLTAAGCQVIYRSVDVCDGAAVGAVIEDVRHALGPIRGLIHGAGALADSLIRNKTPEQFATVFDTKVRGLRRLLDAMVLEDLRHVLLFSSVSGRCGNQGQADYASANEVLNKVAQCLAARLPDCRVASLNWGPWDGGMVRPALKREFENHGITLIPLEAGGRCVADELANAADDSVEVVLGASFEMPAGPARQDDSDSRRSVAPASRRWDHRRDACTTAADSFHLAFERRLDLEGHRFLRSHVLDGRPVLPAAMMMEWLAHAALHANPGLHLQGLDELRVLRGVVLNGSPELLRFYAAPPRRSGEVYDVDVELRSAGRDGAELLHARSTVVLTARPATPPCFTMPGGLIERPYQRGTDGAYAEVLFQGELLYGIRHVDGWSQRGMAAEVLAAPPPETWMEEPLRSNWLTDPLAVDAGFQLAILWCEEEMGAVSLPAYVHRYRQYRTAFPSDALKLALEVRRRDSMKMTADLTYVAADGEVVASMQGYECTVDASLRAAFRRGRMAAPLEG